MKKYNYFTNEEMEAIKLLVKKFSFQKLKSLAYCIILSDTIYKIIKKCETKK